MTHVKYIDKHLNKQKDFNPRQSHIEYEQDALSCKMHSGVKLKILFSEGSGRHLQYLVAPTWPDFEIIKN